MQLTPPLYSLPETRAFSVIIAVFLTEIANENSMPILQSAQRRYATKAFDPNKKLTHEQIETLKAVLRLSPSSINYQPWHFIIATSDEAKAQIAKACPDKMAYNAKKIKESAMTVVLCAKTEATQAHINTIIAQESADGRYVNAQAKAERLAMVNGYIEHLRETPKNIAPWLDKQTYIALGNVLLAAADMGIDSVAIEGFENDIMDTNLGLLEKGYHSTVMAAFGYHSDSDFNAKLAKSRLPDSELFTEL